MQKLNYLIKKLNISKSVWGIFFIAIALRFWGIAYGLPLQLNIDEPSLVSGTLTLSHSLNPERFDWPSLYFYINAVFYFLYSLVKPFLTSMFGVGQDAWSPQAYFVISRALSVIFGSLTVLVIYLLSRKIFSHRVGVIAAILVAILPVHVFESHFAKVDIAHTFVIAIAIYYIWAIFKKGDRFSYIMSGVFIGIATSIKYNGFLLFIPLIIAYLMRRHEEVSSTKNAFQKYFDKKEIFSAFYSGIVSIVTFYIGTPFALIDYKRFFSEERGMGAMWQFKNVGSVTWQAYPAQLFETFVTMFRTDMGLIIWILFSILMLLFLFFNKRTKEYVFLLLPTLIITLYISGLDRSPSHYFLMLIPLYVPATAAFILEIHNKLKQWKYTKFIPLPLFILVIIAPSLWIVLKSNYTLGRADTRNLAYTWVKANIDENNDYMFIIGDDSLTQVEFKKNQVERIKELDRDGIKHREGPFYLLIGIEGVTKADVTEGERDPKIIKGNSTPILKDADLMFYADDTDRLGPPIYIFKVNSVVPDPPKNPGK